MLNYSAKPRPIIDILYKGAATKENLTGCTTPDSKRMAFKPSFIEIPKKNTYGYNPNDSALTPKTPRSTYNTTPTLDSSYRKSPHITPDKQKMRKELSFVQIKP
jgi:hypothetical protein